MYVFSFSILVLSNCQKMKQNQKTDENCSLSFLTRFCPQIYLLSSKMFQIPTDEKFANITSNMIISTTVIESFFSFLFLFLFLCVCVCSSAFLSVLYETHFQFYFCAPETQCLISLNLDFKGYIFFIILM